MRAEASPTTVTPRTCWSPARAGAVIGGLTRFCHHGGATAGRLAARRVSAAQWRPGRGRRVTHPPAQAAPPRDRAGADRPGHPPLGPRVVTA